LSFTFSHVAAAIPLKDMRARGGNNFFDLTALVLGSMAPDFEFFIKLQPIKQSMDIPFGHTLGGMFCYDLPLCFLFAWMFHTIIKAPLFLHLPKPFDRRYTEFAWRKYNIIDIRSFTVFCYSAIIAMAIHIVWDSFTHLNSPLVQYINWLSLPINLFDHTVPLCKLLDHVGTVLGLAFVLRFLYSYNCATSVDPITSISTSRKVFYFGAILSIGIIATVSWVFWYGIPKDSSEIAGPIIVFISGLSIGTIAMSYFTTRLYRIEPPVDSIVMKSTSSRIC
jgi:hypothetical protein